jgi:hypothetical protein
MAAMSIVLGGSDVPKRPEPGMCPALEYACRTRSNGDEFTVETLGRYHLHDVVHHLHDVGAGRG